MLRLLASVGLAVAAAQDDAITSLPTYGKPKSQQYAGFAPTGVEGNQLHYWFTECSCGNDPSTPLVLWLNGGPGASSLTGQFAEKLGAQTITDNATLIDNPDAITTDYHLLTVDNPVGSGYSKTSTKAYVNSEFEMRSQFVAALRIFFTRHPEYAKAPFWVTGESYAGHYVPNIAWEIAVNATEIPLQGIVVGNGMYNMKLQYHLSSCNHLGNLAVLRNLEWAGKQTFLDAVNTPWPSATQVDAHIRRAGLLSYATVMRTGHLVPTVVPKVFKQLLGEFIKPK